MVAYGIAIIPLIKCLNLTYPGGTQTWYDDSSEALGTFDNLEGYFNLLKRNGPA